MLRDGYNFIAKDSNPLHSSKWLDRGESRHRLANNWWDSFYTGCKLKVAEVPGNETGPCAEWHVEFGLRQPLQPLCTSEQVSRGSQCAERIEVWSIGMAPALVGLEAYTTLGIHSLTFKKHFFRKRIWIWVYILVAFRSSLFSSLLLP